MNVEKPHDIVHVLPGQRPPAGYAPLTQREAEILNGRTPDERAEWIKERRAAMDARFELARRKRG